MVLIYISIHYFGIVFFNLSVSNQDRIKFTDGKMNENITWVWWDDSYREKHNRLKKKCWLSHYIQVWKFDFVFNNFSHIKFTQNIQIKLQFTPAGLRTECQPVAKINAQIFLKNKLFIEWTRTHGGWNYLSLVFVLENAHSTIWASFTRHSVPIGFSLLSAAQYKIDASDNFDKFSDA